MEQEPRSVGTHDGSFHADEVTACALLLLCGCVDREKVYRTRDEELLVRCEYVCDVGGIYSPEEKRFDHHQLDYLGEWSSAGMVLDYLHRAGAFSKDEYQYINESLIIGVDAHDNGKELQPLGVCTYSHIIANFAPIAHNTSAEEEEAAFGRALDFALGHLDRLRCRYAYIASCREEVAAAMLAGKETLQFSHSLPWMESFFSLGGEQHPARFLLMPAGEHWKVRGIPPTLAQKMNVRAPHPASWAGLSGEALEEVSGVSGAVFCHKGRFISVWESRQAAEKAVQKLLAILNDGEGDE